LLIGKQGDGELVRDLLQQACLRLKEGGSFLAATDHPHDTWLGEQLDRLYGKITRRVHETGTVYQAIKVASPKKIKHYDAQFTIRDEGRELTLTTRPGVFSHRELDRGAQLLLKAMMIEPDAHVLDIGCGSGAIALAAAARGAARVHAIDSNARAVQCVEASARENGFEQITATLDCDGRTVEREAFDLAVANPPYFANYRIAELFARIALAALRPLGLLLIVTKTPQWYNDRLPEMGYFDLEVEPAKNYVIVKAWKQTEPEPYPR
jgi:16S rRNA (guanine1207-N2)-methyltransferase